LQKQNFMENIYITWHYTTHGIAYLKHILSAFYGKNTDLFKYKINISQISQDEMNTVFDKETNGFIFDKVYYLTSSQESFDKLSHRRFKYRTNMLTDEVIIEQKMQVIWKKLIEQSTNSLKQDRDFILQNFSTHKEKFEQLVWRDIHHYPIKDQINWFKNDSNASNFYSDKFEEIKLNITDFRNTNMIAEQLIPVIKKITAKHKAANFIINLSLGSNETQVSWHILAENNFLPIKTKFITTYDDKSSNKNKRLKFFDIKEQPLKLITKISDQFNIYNKTKLQTRKIADIKMKNYINRGFAILVLGERGTGKTQLVKESKGIKNFAEANCASFDDDNKAESDLFGYEKGAFTGANSKTEGLFHQANGGILFLDEIHHLSKRVQAKLTTALQTDKQNFFTIRRLGANKPEKIKTTVIFATNLTINQLREKLYPDLFDRITQLIIEIPALREIPEERFDYWDATWNHMRFIEETPTPKEPELINWLNKLNLYGNFRDLQKIAIYYYSFSKFSSEEKKIIGLNNAFNFTKNEFNRYYSEKNEAKNNFFDKSKSLKEMQILFQKNLATWLISEFGSAKKATDYFKNNKKDSITERTIYKWKNGK